MGELVGKREEGEAMLLIAYVFREGINLISVLARVHYQ